MNAPSPASPDSLWSDTLKAMQESLPAQEFDMWFSSTELESIEDKEANVTVPDSLHRDRLTQRYLTKLQAILSDLTGSKLTVTISVRKRSAQGRSGASEPHRKALPRKKTQAPPSLSADYTFERFVIGENNSFAANAARAIAKNPGKAYNPCLIYGGVGLGKTHLLQAIGNDVYREFPDLKIAYVTAESFTNEFILSIGQQRTHHFKNRYRSMDVLLIDDIHFLPGKKGTQEELFHTFNALHDSNKQMVFTCDRPVSELRELTDRLKSRFSMGLNVDLQPPEYETRVAILRKKIDEKGVSVPVDVIELICRNIRTNVRDLERALTNLLAYADLVNAEISVEVAQRRLQDHFASPEQKNIPVELIQRVVAEYFSLSHADMKGNRRTKAIAFPRQLAMYITREITEFSTTEIGNAFGGRDHTTVMHACQKVEDKIRTDDTLEPTIQYLIRSIKGHGGEAG
jgi:chromosomal replication initiator protein